MTPSIPDSQLEQFIEESGWDPRHEIGTKRGILAYDPNEEHVLVFAEDNIVNILDLDGQVYQIAERGRMVFSIASHMGKLYESRGDWSIYETLTGDRVASRDGIVKALVSHNGRLYDSGHFQKIYDTIDNRILIDTQASVSDLTSDGGSLLYANQTGIFNASEHGKQIYQTDAIETILSVAAHNRTIYAVSSPHVHVKDVLSGKKISYNEEHIRNLRIHDGNLLASTDNGIIHDCSSDEIIARREGTIYSICSHPRIVLVDAGVLPP